MTKESEKTQEQLDQEAYEEYMNDSMELEDRLGNEDSCPSGMEEDYNRGF